MLLVIGIFLILPDDLDVDPARRTIKCGLPFDHADHI